jgi:hypothetical protein
MAVVRGGARLRGGVLARDGGGGLRRAGLDVVSGASSRSLQFWLWASVRARSGFLRPAAGAGGGV